MTPDAALLLDRIRAIAAGRHPARAHLYAGPHYVDAVWTFGTWDKPEHPRTLRAVTELVHLGYIEHRNTGALDLT